MDHRAKTGRLLQAEIITLLIQYLAEWDTKIPDPILKKNYRDRMRARLDELARIGGYNQAAQREPLGDTKRGT
jgi:hypothetical protein